VLRAGVTGTGGTITYAYSGNATTTLTNANSLEFYGGHVTVGGNIVPITVSVSYVGSSAGIQAVAGQIPVQFLPNNVTPGGGSNGGGAYPEPNGNTNAAQYYSTIPQFTASDEFQGSTPWEGTNSLNTNYGSPIDYQTLTSEIVGILPYRFVTNVDAPSTIANITPEQARQLWETGYIYLSQLTGQNADEGGIVYALGRDVGSGLRTVLLSETGIGVRTSVVQYEPVLTTSTNPYLSGQYTSHAGAIVTGGTYAYVSGTANLPVYANETINGLPLLNGDAGYPSFTNLGNALAAYTNTTGTNGGAGNLTNAALSGTAGWFVTGLADSDAQTAFSNGAHEVAWNGVYLGTLPAGGGASTQLAEGYYTFWSYLQLQFLPTASNYSSTASALVSALYTDLYNTDATVLLKNVNIGRTQDGGNILPYQPY